ncbi:MAG TPA: hypothetical protein VD838_21285, partial [Anaeromyxobacteraceae bacterium]|nr:hypothetical protein [Anaeromyxobacteraceae bacterium]
MALSPLHTSDRPAAPRRIPRPARVAAVVLLALALLQLTAQAALELPIVERWLRARLQETLASRARAPVELGPEVDVDALYRVTFGPIDLEAPADGVARVRVERVKVRPRWSALLAGRVEPATVRVYGVKVEVEPGRTRGADLPPSPRPSPPAAPSTSARHDAGGEGGLPLVHLRDVEVSILWRGATVAFPALDGRISGTRGPTRDVVELSLRRGRAHAELTFRRDAGQGLSLDGRLERVPARRIPRELLHGVATPLDGEISGELRVRAPGDLSRAELAFRLDASRLVVEGAALGEEPIGPVDAALSGRLALDRAAREVRLEDGALELLGALRVRATGSGRLDPGLPIALAIEAKDVDYRALASALPPALALPDDA